MSEKEKQQLKKDIENGKVDIDDLYEKYQINMPLMFLIKNINKSMAKLLLKNTKKTIWILKLIFYLCRYNRRI